MLKFIDGHNDLLLNLWLNYPENLDQFFYKISPGHLDFPRIQASNLGAALCAIFIPPAEYIQRYYPLHAQKLADPLEVMFQQLAILKRIAELSEGRAEVCLTVKQLRSCLERGVFAMVAHIEGAGALDTEGIALAKFYAAGVRSVGPFWNRVNQFGEGVIGGFPGSPDSGAGLTAVGKKLIRQLNQYRMLVDVSHMNERAFWDTVEISDAPIVATHSSVYQLCQQPRNLTDEQLRAIQHSDGLVGINFGNAFIRADGQRNSNTALGILADHFCHVAELIGARHLALGSDFDGVCVPKELGDVTGLPKFFTLLQQRGFSNTMLNAIAQDNWLRTLESIWEQ